MVQGSTAAARLGAALWVIGSMLAPAQAQMPDPAKVEFRAEKLAENLHVLFGAGGNVGVLTGPEGTLLIDDELEVMSTKLRAAVALLSNDPARFVLNTHFHFDHAGGNAVFGRNGSVIIAHDNVRKRLSGKQFIEDLNLTTEATPASGLPVVTFADGVTLHLNGEQVTVTHVANAHTDSDSFVFFSNANVLHTGDLYMSIGYPFIDASNGGSLDGLIAAHAKALSRCNDATRVIPGHGPMAVKADLQAYHDMLVEIRKRVSALIRQGQTQEQVLAARPTAQFDEKYGKGFIRPEVLVRRAYIDLYKARKNQK